MKITIAHRDKDGERIENYVHDVEDWDIDEGHLWLYHADESRTVYAPGKWFSIHQEPRELSKAEKRLRDALLGIPDEPKPVKIADCYDVDVKDRNGNLWIRHGYEWSSDVYVRRFDSFELFKIFGPLTTLDGKPVEL